MNNTASPQSPGGLEGSSVLSSPAIAGLSDTRKRMTAVFGGTIGNLIEWYDWYVYSTFSLYFAKAFFPSTDRTSELLDAAAVFAVGFLIRPIGSWALGRYSDRFGRKSALQFSIL